MGGLYVVGQRCASTTSKERRQIVIGLWSWTAHLLWRGPRAQLLGSTKATQRVQQQMQRGPWIWIQPTKMRAECWRIGVMSDVACVSTRRMPNYVQWSLSLVCVLA